jgi:hypothetical protein
VTKVFWRTTLLVQASGAELRPPFGSTRQGNHLLGEIVGCSLIEITSLAGYFLMAREG